MKIRSLLLFFVVIVCAFIETAGAQNAIVYQNPISSSLEDAWDDYGFGDPFVFRYNGRYYLYPSTRDDSIGVKCWSSRDLVHWRYEGLVTAEPTSKGAYAPEIFRANDAFYMVTSPAGRGHYIYRSVSPTGPFERVTENFGLSIDGSVFIDDDGRGYFYSASDRGILAYQMKSPTEVAPEPIEIGAFMHGWTEGPSVFKHDGIYYTTYTGNHVFSRGYRIDAGAGNSPLSFCETPKNPILISTEGTLFGIGHNSVVKGPNLDLYYIVYHSLTGHGKKIGWPVRETNIDQLVLDGDRVFAVGPTRGRRQILLPDVAAWFESKEELEQSVSFSKNADIKNLEIKDNALRLPKGVQVGLQGELNGDFTAEFNLAIPDLQGRAGVFFCRKDDVNYGRLEIDRASESAFVVFVGGGEEKRESFELPKLFGETVSFEQLRSIQIEKTGTRFRFYIDDRLAYETFYETSGGGTIGYYSDASYALCGYAGGTNATEGRSVKQLAFPVPGCVPTCALTTSAGKEAAETIDDGRRLRAVTLKDGDSLDLPLYAETTGNYSATIRYSSTTGGAVSVKNERGELNVFRFLETQVGDLPNFVADVVRDLPLEQGKNVLTLTCPQGNITIDYAELTSGEDASALDDFSQYVDKPEYSDGKWNVKNGVLSASGDLFGKRLYGDNAWGDYSVEADMTFESKQGNAGLLLRASQPALGGPNNSAALGTNFFIGYYVGVQDDRLVLERRSYTSAKILTSTRVNVREGKKIHLDVYIAGSSIHVSVNGNEEIGYVDAEPIVAGRFGVRACGGGVSVENLRVKPLL